jgi:hypothetical protein
VGYRQGKTQFMHSGSSHDLPSLIFTLYIQHSLRQPLWAFLIDAELAFDPILREDVIYSAYNAGLPGTSSSTLTTTSAPVVPTHILTGHCPALSHIKLHCFNVWTQTLSESPHLSPIISVATKGSNNTFQSFLLNPSTFLT